MSDKQKKRYYWLKLKEDFFEEDTIEWLEEQPNGKEYCLFYLKLCLKSLKTEGLLVRNVGNMMIPYDPESLAKLTNSKADTVKVAMDLFQKIGLIQMLDSGEIYMNQLNEMVGTETEAARQKRLQRSKEDNVQTLSGKRPPELELEIEIEKEIKNTKSDKSDSASIFTKLCNEVVDYLNQKAKSNFKATTKATQTKIRARLAEGFNVDDFKKVIDIKTAEWLDDANMSQYLRPETLFGTKFESYLNQKQAVKRVNAQNNWVKSPVKHEEMPNWNLRSTGSDPSRKAEIEKMMNEFFTDNEEEDK
ncbi:conserved phage C-terminal domain-containing protein [Enterococcus montenegrensis]|uniref:conserved phage C-terminal domain-containing protein n=1 Tax=Enterococcus montenegrensis TaxID=3031993 RepID=UPI00249F134C|nr:conserved phage C-terminal domain-containing protein [Enterococcus montenegrensis]WHA08814.1 conserved phage C-terminal domain-containing protein [Enterococcus montenegrensis]